MSLVLSPGLAPVFAFTKDVLLLYGLLFMAYGLTQIVYGAIRMRERSIERAK